MAMQMTEEVVALRRDEVVGLGMDAAEAPDPPEKFAECFRSPPTPACTHQPRLGRRPTRQHHDVPRRARL